MSDIIFTHRHAIVAQKPLSHAAREVKSRCMPPIFYYEKQKLFRRQSRRDELHDAAMRAYPSRIAQHAATPRVYASRDGLDAMLLGQRMPPSATPPATAQHDFMPPTSFTGDIAGPFSYLGRRLRQKILLHDFLRALFPVPA